MLVFSFTSLVKRQIVLTPGNWRTASSGDEGGIVYPAHYFKLLFYSRPCGAHTGIV